MLEMHVICDVTEEETLPSSYTTCAWGKGQKRRGKGGFPF